MVKKRGRVGYVRILILKESNREKSEVDSVGERYIEKEEKGNEKRKKQI